MIKYNEKAFDELLEIMDKLSKDSSSVGKDAPKVKELFETFEDVINFDEIRFLNSYVKYLSYRWHEAIDFANRSVERHKDEFKGDLKEFKFNSLMNMLDIMTMKYRSIEADFNDEGKMKV